MCNSPKGSSVELGMGGHLHGCQEEFETDAVLTDKASGERLPEIAVT